MFKNYMYLFLMAVTFTGCIGGYVIIPIIIPVASTTPAYPTVFSLHDKDFMPWYEEKVDSLNTLVKAWYNYSVEYSPKKEYIVKVYDKDLDLLISRITFKDDLLVNKNGKEIHWADAGHKLQEGYYINSMKTYKWKFYNIEEGYVELEGLYLNGKRKKDWNQYNEHGVLQENVELKEPAVLQFREYSDTLYYQRELTLNGSFVVNSGFHRNRGLKARLNEEAGLNRILDTCKEGAMSQKIECTRSSIMRWIGNVNERLGKENVIKTLPAIVSLNVSSEGVATLKIIRGLSNHVRKVIQEEFEKMNFKFDPRRGTGDVYYFNL